MDGVIWQLRDLLLGRHSLLELAHVAALDLHASDHHRVLDRGAPLHVLQHTDAH